MNVDKVKSICERIAWNDIFLAMVLAKDRADFHGVDNNPKKYLETYNALGELMNEVKK